MNEWTKEWAQELLNERMNLNEYKNIYNEGIIE